MEDLRQATFDYACSKFVDEVLAFENQPDFMPKVVFSWTIDLARNKPHLYRLLYFSGGFQGESLMEFMMTYENNQKMIVKMSELYGLNLESCKRYSYAEL